MKRKQLGLLALFAISGIAVGAHAQIRKAPPTSSAAGSATSTVPNNLRAHVGTDNATRLLKSLDAEERLRGVERLATIGTPEAVSLLASSVDASQALRSDPRALIEASRALAKFTDNERARAALLQILIVGNPGIGSRLPTTTTRGSEQQQLDEGDPIARTELAREVAAIALAKSGYERAVEQVYGVAKGGGAGQNAAVLALTYYPPRDASLFGTSATTMPVPVIRLLGRLGDLRALELLQSAGKSTDANVRAAALLALGELGDARGAALAKTAIAEADARLRGAAAECLVLLGAPERFKAVAALIVDDATAATGIRLAERVYHVEITKLLATKATDHPDREIRLAAIRALGRSPDVNAASALASPKLLGDASVQYPALHALARSPAANATSLVSAVAAGNLKSVGVRAYVVRALARGERTDQGDGVIKGLAASKEPRDRALATFAKVALGDLNAEDALSDTDARIRHAAVMGLHAKPSKSVDKKLLARLAVEKDGTTKQALALGLMSGDPDEALTTTYLLERAEAGAGDSPLAAFAYARRADEKVSAKIALLLGSKDAVIRAHTARGLADAPLPDATGRLADAYEYETDVDVRRAIITALAQRTADATSPARKKTLEVAAQFDPDGPTQRAAKRALAGTTEPFGAPQSTEVGWYRLASPSGGAPNEPYAGAIVRSDGVALPIVFDDDGYAVVPGLPAGDARLVLTPRLPRNAP